jgi:drug/metabolite transporter (DMT)-like permease
VTNQTLAYYLALGSTLAFSFASLLFADIARKISPLWMNVFKASLAWVCFGITSLIVGWAVIGPKAAAGMFASGVLGLGIADVFLLYAYARIGAARTLILFGFQPLLLSVEGHFLFHQDMSWGALVAVVFFMACLFTFSLERFRHEGHWELIGLAAALIGTLLDNSGVVLSRWAFDATPALSAFQANLIRSTGALMFFAVFGRFQKVHFVAGWKKLGARGQRLAFLAAFLGTFVSLCLYLTAVKIGVLGSISALGAAGPIFTSIMECIYLRRMPNRFLSIALGLFVIGFLILNLA